MNTVNPKEPLPDNERLTLPVFCLIGLLFWIVVLDPNMTSTIGSDYGSYLVSVLNALL